MRRMLPLFLILALCACATLLAVQWHRASTAEHAIQETTLSALSETAELMDQLSLTLEKTLIAQDAALCAQLLAQISRDAGDIRRAMAALPDESGRLLPAMAAIEQLSEDAASLLPALVDAGRLGEEQRRLLADHQAECALLAGHFAAARQEALAGHSTLSASAEAPLLPSPTHEAAEARGLTGRSVTAEEALTIAGNFVGMDRVREVSSAPHVTGSLPAWGVAVHTDDLLLHLEITQTGGKVLLMSPETAGFSPQRTVDDCLLASAAFLAEKGFYAMEPVWLEQYDGMCVFTFTAVQDDVLLYPDRVMVQVRMDTAEIVGLEARSYWLNHVPRHLPKPALSAAEAAEAISPALTVLSERLCLIPHHGKETLCWEFTARMNEETYMVYVDAATGREVALQKAVPLQDGQTAA